MQNRIDYRKNIVIPEIFTLLIFALLVFAVIYYLRLQEAVNVRCNKNSFKLKFQVLNSHSFFPMSVIIIYVGSHCIKYIYIYIYIYVFESLKVGNSKFFYIFCAP